MGKYYLSYAFDKNCNISKTLKTDELEELDKFTTKFNNSNEIREYYKNEISLFRIENENYINSIEQNGRRETGDITLYTITDNNRIPSNERKMVLYSYHIDLFNDLIENKELMKMLSVRSYYEIKNRVSEEASSIYQLSEYDSKIFTFYKSYGKPLYRKVLKKYKENLIKSPKYFSTIREVFKIYNSLYSKMISTGKEMESLNTLVNRYKNRTLLKKNKLYKNNLSGKISFQSIISDDYINEDSEYNQDYYYSNGVTRNYIDNNPDSFETDCDIDLKKLDPEDSYYRHRR
ncbi:MAG: hypothetical protein NC181_02110 [Clostridium sp.]|nr:hypothetical protein [Clostridium sp.]MCM1444101.1 hypothetical protein [Candidatus Amulumruptor caecigallinarius]